MGWFGISSALFWSFYPSNMSTPTPVPPTPTPAITPWYTPTPWPTANPASIPIHLSASDIQTSFVRMAEYSVQAWQTANQTGQIDNVITAVLFMMIIFGIMSVRRHLERI